MKALRFPTLTLLFCFCLNALVLAQEQSVKPGINDNYEKTTVEKKVKQFESEGRDVVKKKNEIIDLCELKPGMNVADVGAGTGLFTRLFAPKVEPKGKVFAVDITEKFLKHIDTTCSEQNIENVVTVLCTPDSAKLKDDSVDLVFTCNTYHHFEYPQKTLASIHKALRPGGRLIVIDFKKKEGVASEHMIAHVRAGQETVVNEITEAGFKLIDAPPVMEKQYVLRFEKVEKK